MVVENGLGVYLFFEMITSRVMEEEFRRIIKMFPDGRSDKWGILQVRLINPIRGLVGVKAKDKKGLKKFYNIFRSQVKVVMVRDPNSYVRLMR